MKEILIRATQIFLVCTAIAGAVYWAFDTMATIGDLPGLRRVWVLILPVYGIFITYSLFKLVPEGYWLVRTAVLKPLEGKHYQYLSWSIQVWEDEDHCRWTSTKDLRDILGQLASESALANLYPSGYQRAAKAKYGYLRDDALLLHLTQASAMPAIKFKNWAERNIAFPARTTRKRMGVTIAAPTAQPDE